MNSTQNYPVEMVKFSFKKWAWFIQNSWILICKSRLCWNTIKAQLNSALFVYGFNIRFRPLCIIVYVDGWWYAMPYVNWIKRFYKIHFHINPHHWLLFVDHIEVFIVYSWTASNKSFSFVKWNSNRNQFRLFSSISFALGMNHSILLRSTLNWKFSIFVSINN